MSGTVRIGCFCRCARTLRYILNIQCLSVVVLYMHTLYKNIVCMLNWRVFFMESQDTNGVKLHLNSTFFTFVGQLFDIRSFIFTLKAF